MVGICSLSEAFTDDEVASSGIGRHFRKGRLGSRDRFAGNFCRNRFGGGGLYGGGFSSRIFGCFKFFWRRRVENTRSQRSQGSLRRRQNLLAVSVARIGRVNLGFDLRAEFVRSASELVQKARDLAADHGHFLWAEENQRQKEDEDHLA